MLPGLGDRAESLEVTDLQPQTPQHQQAEALIAQLHGDHYPEW